MPSLFNRLRSHSPPPRTSTSTNSTPSTSPSTHTFGNFNSGARRSESIPDTQTSQPLNITNIALNNSASNTLIIDNSSTPIALSSPSPASPSSTATPSTATAGIPGFAGLQKIHPNPSLVTRTPSISRPGASSPPPPATGNILSPRPANDRRGSSGERRDSLPSTSTTPAGVVARRERAGSTPVLGRGVEAIRESNESEHPAALSADLPSAEQQPQPETPNEPAANVSRSSPRRTTGLFSAVPFSGGTGWNTFGKSRKVSKDPGSSPGGLYLEYSISRTSSQSRRTGSTSSKPRSKGGNLSRSGSANLQQYDSGKAGLNEFGTEHIEQASYSRIPKTSNDLNDPSSNSSPNNNTPKDVSVKPTPSTPSFPTQPPSPTRHKHSAPEIQRQSRIDTTFPPRTTITTKQDTRGDVPTSLPFTFGRSPSGRLGAGDIFVDEFGSQQQHHTEPFPSSDPPSLRSPSEPGGRAYLSSESNASETHPRVPSLVSDSSEMAKVGGSSGTLSSNGKELFGVPSLGSMGDELTLATGGGGSNLSSKAKELSEERRRRKSASSNGGGGLIRRTSSGRLLEGGGGGGPLKRGKSVEMGLGLGLGVMQEPVIVYSAEVPEKKEEELPSITRSSSQRAGSEPSTSQPSVHQPVASTSTPQRHPTEASSTVVDSPSSSEHLHVQPPEVTVTGPTPRPSPASTSPSRPFPTHNASNRLSALFQSHVPDSHAHPSGIGISGVETHSRRGSLKVVGKRKARDGDLEVEDKGEERVRTGSNAPSSYHRKRLKTSNTSDIDASHLRTPASHALVPSTSRSSNPPATAASTGSSRPRSMSSTRPKSITSTRPKSITSTRPGTSTSKQARVRPLSSMSQTSIPFSAILTPRAPSIHHSITSRREGGQRIRYEDPLKNRVQKRRGREVWADSWKFEGDIVVQQRLFLAGFVLFPLWWLGVFWPVYRVEDEHGQLHWRWTTPHPPEDVEGKGKGSSIGVMERSLSGLWTDSEPFESEKRRLWRGRCLWAAIVGTVFWVVVIVLAVVLSKR